MSASWYWIAPSPKLHILTFPHCHFRAVSQSYLRCCLLGCSPRFAPDKTELATLKLYIFFLVDTCFLKLPANSCAAVGTTEKLCRGYLLAVSQGGGGYFVLNFLCAKDQAKGNSTGQVFSRFSRRLWRGFLGMFFPLLFPPILQLLSPSMPLFTKYWASHHLFIS